MRKIQHKRIVLILCVSFVWLLDADLASARLRMIDNRTAGDNGQRGFPSLMYCERCSAACIGGQPESEELRRHFVSKPGASPIPGAWKPISFSTSVPFDILAQNLFAEKPSKLNWAQDPSAEKPSRLNLAQNPFTGKQPEPAWAQNPFTERHSGVAWARNPFQTTRSVHIWAKNPFRSGLSNFMWAKNPF